MGQDGTSLLCNIDKDDCRTSYPLCDDTNQTWLREDAQVFLYIRDSI